MGGEATQLILIIVALVVVYGGVMFWTKRSGKDKKAQPLAPRLEDLGGDSGETALDGSVTSRDGSGPKKNSERFKLTGRDAEVAAKVLKRMLKQGREEK